MTFIASVKARDGVAIVADSLVTTSKLVVDWETYNNYLQRYRAKHGGHQEFLPVEEITKLFDYQLSHTQDFGSKLIQYDEFTAITLSGAAGINGRTVEQIVQAIPRGSVYARKGHLAKIEELCFHVVDQIKLHLTRFPFDGVKMIITHFDPSRCETVLHEVVFNKASLETLKDAEFEFYHLQDHSSQSIVCAGQNRISERILHGELANMRVWREVTKTILIEFALDHGINEISPTYFEDKLSLPRLLDMLPHKDIPIRHLKALSLQQAVNLAWLLMKIEVELQEYTKTIPTVGGVIKLVVIDKRGFRFIKGEEIIHPI